MAKLMHGVTVVYSQQVSYILKEVSCIQLQLILSQVTRQYEPNSTASKGEKKFTKKIAFLDDHSGFDLRMDFSRSFEPNTSTTLKEVDIPQATTCFLNISIDDADRREALGLVDFDLDLENQDKSLADLDMSSILPDFSQGIPGSIHGEITAPSLYSSAIPMGPPIAPVKLLKKRKIVVDDETTGSEDSKKQCTETVNSKTLTSREVRNCFFSTPSTLNTLTSYCYRCIFQNVPLVNYFDRSDFRELQSTIMRSIEHVSVEQEMGRNLMLALVSLAEATDEGFVPFNLPELQPNLRSDDFNITLPDLGLQDSWHEESSSVDSVFDVSAVLNEVTHEKARIPASLTNQLGRFYQFMVMRGLKCGSVSRKQGTSGPTSEISFEITLKKLLPSTSGDQSEPPVSRPIAARSFNSLLELASRNIVGIYEADNDVRLTVAVETTISAN